MYRTYSNQVIVSDMNLFQLSIFAKSYCVICVIIHNDLIFKIKWIYIGLYWSSPMIIIFSLWLKHYQLNVHYMVLLKPLKFSNNLLIFIEYGIGQNYKKKFRYIPARIWDALCGFMKWHMTFNCNSYNLGFIKYDFWIDSDYLQ